MAKLDSGKPDIDPVVALEQRVADLEKLVVSLGKAAHADFQNISEAHNSLVEAHNKLLAAARENFENLFENDRKLALAVDLHGHIVVGYPLPLFLR